MEILAIESSGLVAGTAVVEDGITKAEFTISNELNHSVTLLSMIRDMLKISGIRLKDIDAIAISRGPGSFTGLRIGVALAKGLALVLDIPVIQVGTLDSMGIICSERCADLICPILDARRRQVYCAAYLKGDRVIDEDVCDIVLFLQKLNSLISSRTLSPAESPEVFFSGDGAFSYRDIILEYAGNADETDICFKPRFASPPFDQQSALAVAFLGEKYYKNWLFNRDLSPDEAKKTGSDKLKKENLFDGVVINSDDLVPLYIRKSQAEQKNEAGKLMDAGLNSIKKMQQSKTWKQ